MPNIISPVDGTVLCSGTPVLTWSNLGVGITYDVQIASDSGYTVSLQESLAGAGTSWTVPTALAVGSYVWHVRAIDGTCSGSWSADIDLTISTIFVPTLL